MDTGTNDLTKGKNVLNVKKIIKSVRGFFPQVKLVFSGLIVRKDKKNINKGVLDRNVRLRNFCNPKNFIKSITPLSKKIIWGQKSYTLIKEAIRWFHKTYGIDNQNIEKILTLTASRKVMININLKT